MRLQRAAKVFITLSVALGSPVAAGGQFGFDVHETQAQLLRDAPEAACPRRGLVQLAFLRATALLLHLWGFDRDRGSSLARMDRGAVAAEMADETTPRCVGWSAKSSSRNLACNSTITRWPLSRCCVNGVRAIAFMGRCVA